MEIIKNNREDKEYIDKEYIDKKYIDKEYIDKAVEHYRKLLEAQVKRQDEMAKESSFKDFKSIDKITVGLADGDGIGPYIMQKAKELLNILLKDEIQSGKVILKDIQGLTIENRLRLGKSVPEDVLEEIKSCDVLLKGPTETPKGGNMESANVSLRRELDLFANVRPVKLEEEGIDWVFFRENTEGEYVLGSQGIEIPEKLCMDFKVTTLDGTRRIAKMAFDYAKANGKNNVAIVTKANIMKKTDGFFSEICHEVANEYEGITAEDYYIDIMTANLVNKDIRSSFQVFLLPNLYGDIITDEAAQIQGGVGTAGSANIGRSFAMFEAIHGSAPRMIADGLTDYVNPASIFKATEMMLRHIGFTDKAEVLSNVLSKTQSMQPTGTKNGPSCKDYCELIKSKLH